MWGRPLACAERPARLLEHSVTSEERGWEPRADGASAPPSPATNKRTQGSQVSYPPLLPAFEGDDAPDLVAGLFELFQNLRHEPNFFRRHDQNHAHAQVERAAVIVVGHLADVFQKFEDRLRGPSVRIDLDPAIEREYPGHIVGNPASGDVGRGL